MLAFLNMLSPLHLLLLGVVALLLFGNRLPEVARSMGKAVTEFKKGLRDVSDEFNKEAGGDDDPPKRKLSPPADEAATPDEAEERSREPVESGEKSSDSD